MRKVIFIFLYYNYLREKTAYALFRRRSELREGPKEGELNVLRNWINHFYMRYCRKISRISCYDLYIIN
jgi:hypothetical protein